MNREQFERWQGSDNMTPDILAELILELANGDYSLDDFRKDVAAYE